MDYYTRKLKAINLIDKLLAAGTEDEDIVFSVETSCGLGEKFVMARIKSVQEKIKRENK